MNGIVKYVMKYSPLVDRIQGEVAAWTIHGQAREAQLRGEDVIVLSIGDPELEMPAAVLDRAMKSYGPRRCSLYACSGTLGPARGHSQAHQRRTGQPAEADNVIFLSAHRTRSSPRRCVWPAQAMKCSRWSRCTRAIGNHQSVGRAYWCAFRTGFGWFSPQLARPRSRHHAANARIVFRDAQQSERRDPERGGSERHRRACAPAPLWIVADEVYAGLAPGGRVPCLATRLPNES